MQQNTLYKSKQIFGLVVKLFIVIGCVYFIYFKLLQNDQLSFTNFYSTLVKTDIFTIKNISILILFSILNWFFEIKKWHLLANQAKKTKITKAITQSLSSLTVSLITPNRIGEYGAKAVYFKKSLRKKILGLNLVGNLFQLASTMFFGVLGLLFLAQDFNIQAYTQPIIVIILSLILLIVFIRTLYKRDFSIKGYSLKSLCTFIIKIPNYTTLKIGLYAVLRYLIFSHQFYFLLLIFDIDISYIDALFSIFSMYFLASIVPMLSFFDVIIKSSISIWVFSFYNCNETHIISIVLIMWILNFVLPSIVGSYFVLTFDTNKLITSKE